MATYKPSTQAFVPLTLVALALAALASSHLCARTQERRVPPTQKESGRYQFGVKVEPGLRTMAPEDSTFVAHYRPSDHRLFIFQRATFERLVAKHFVTGKWLTRVRFQLTLPLRGTSEANAKGASTVVCDVQWAKLPPNHSTSPVFADSPGKESGGISDALTIESGHLMNVKDSLGPPELDSFLLGLYKGSVPKGGTMRYAHRAYVIVAPGGDGAWFTDPIQYCRVYFYSDAKGTQYTGYQQKTWTVDAVFGYAYPNPK